ncbi:MAG TPA: hypothetical protein VK781_02530 [Solirubrobacteraceae bacterium]|nr:hypothetical protein [Solirubrobacteraceae bacterium]
MMQEQSRRLSEPLRWTRGGRLAVIAASALLLVALATVAVIASTTGSRQPGCIEVTYASSLGAALMHPCGVHAREACARPSQYPAAAAHGALREACGRAGLAYGGSEGATH